MLELLRFVFEPYEARLIAWIAAGIIGLGLAALIYAKILHARVARWPRAQGRILSSEAGFELRQRFKNEQPRNERVAKIAYEYDVDGRKMRSNRILDSGHPPEDQVERLLAAYPKDRPVAVYYNPKDPSQTALEIDHPPKDLAIGCLAATAIVIVFALIAILLVRFGFGTLAILLPDAILPLTLTTFVLGALLLVLFVAFNRQARAAERWPRATGRIDISEIQEFQRMRDKTRSTRHGRTRMETMYMPVVEYSYSVGGKAYSSRSIWDGTEVSGSRAYALRIANRYPAGTVVMVHYDPADPRKAALEIGGTWHWAMLVGALVAFGVSAASSGLLF